MARNIKPRKRATSAPIVDDTKEEVVKPPVTARKSSRKKPVNDDDDDTGSEVDPYAGMSKKARAAAERAARIEARSIVDEDSVDFGGSELIIPSGQKVLHTPAALIKAMATYAKASSGSEDYFLGSEIESLLIGIPMPSIAMEFLLGLDAFPLGIVAVVVSEHGVGKSALLAEFGRWFFMFGGGFYLTEAESKFNPKWYESLLRQYWQYVQFTRSKTQEDWQRNLTNGIKSAKLLQQGTKKKPGVGFINPFLYGVDSIGGKASEQQQEKIVGAVGKDGTLGKGEGHATQDFSGARSAAVNTAYMKTISSQLDGYPYSLVFINQLKVGIDQKGGYEEIRALSGGKQFNFQESFEIQLARVRGQKYKVVSTNFVGYPIKMTTFKNSFGEGQREIETRLLWRHVASEKNIGRMDQQTVWDWNWSLINLLNGILNGGKHSYFKPRLIKEGIHVDCPTTTDISNKAYSRTIGMEKKDAVSWSELGKRFQRDPVIVEKLRRALCIGHVPLLNGDYKKQMASLRAKAK